MRSTPRPNWNESLVGARTLAEAWSAPTPPPGRCALRGGVGRALGTVRKWQRGCAGRGRAIPGLVFRKAWQRRGRGVFCRERRLSGLADRCHSSRLSQTVRPQRDLPRAAGNVPGHSGMHPRCGVGQRARAGSLRGRWRELRQRRSVLRGHLRGRDLRPFPVPWRRCELPASGGLLFVSLPAGQQRAAFLRLGPRVRQHGAACGRAAACCGLACAAAGTCGGTLCAQGGAACAVAGDCVVDAATPASARRPGRECRVAGETRASGRVTVAVASAGLSPRVLAAAYCKAVVAWRAKPAAMPPTAARDCARSAPMARPIARPCRAARSFPNAVRRPRIVVPVCVARMAAARARADVSPRTNAANPTTTAAPAAAVGSPRGFSVCAGCEGLQARAGSRARNPPTAATPRPCATPTTAARWPAPALGEGTGHVRWPRIAAHPCVRPALQASWPAAILRPHRRPLHERRGLLLGKLRRFSRFSACRVSGGVCRLPKAICRTPQRRCWPGRRHRWHPADCRW